jgi:hypothetical protein
VLLICRDGNGYIAQMSVTKIGREKATLYVAKIDGEERPSCEDGRG